MNIQLMLMAAKKTPAVMSRREVSQDGFGHFNTVVRACNHRKSPRLKLSFFTSMPFAGAPAVILTAPPNHLWISEWPSAKAMPQAPL
jgi:hypothetical protein